MINGLTYLNDFLNQIEQDKLLNEIDKQPWLNDLNRRTQHYGYKYDYKTRKIDLSMRLGELPSFILNTAQKLLDQKLIKSLPDQAIVNEYLPGQGIAAHIDCEPCFDDIITTLSLGWAYEMEFTSNKQKATILLDLGSILVLKDDARYKWKHQIRARKSDNSIARKRRVSLTFRNVILK